MMATLGGGGEAAAALLATWWGQAQARRSSHATLCCALVPMLAYTRNHTGIKRSGDAHMAFCSFYFPGFFGSDQVFFFSFLLGMEHRLHQPAKQPNYNLQLISASLFCRSSPSTSTAAATDQPCKSSPA
jgi:hypothetical protein